MGGAPPQPQTAPAQGIVEAAPAADEEQVLPTPARWAWAAPRRLRRRHGTPSTATPPASRPGSSSLGGTWHELPLEESMEVPLDYEVPEAPSAAARLSEAPALAPAGLQYAATLTSWDLEQGVVAMGKGSKAPQVLKKPSVKKNTKKSQASGTKRSGSSSSLLPIATGSAKDDVVRINRAPVLTLWMTVCMRRLGYKEELSLTEMILRLRVHAPLVVASALLLFQVRAEENCSSDTGGSCFLFGCADWRNAQCVQGHCFCRPNECAVNGQCLPKSNWTKPAHRSRHPERKRVRGKGNFTALVLSGGGAKGAYELGVLEGICRNDSLHKYRTPRGLDCESLGQSIVM
eukprot:s658_g4.t2